MRTRKNKEAQNVKSEPEAWQNCISQVVGDKLVTYNAEELRIQGITPEQKTLLEQDFSLRALRRRHKRDLPILTGFVGAGIISSYLESADVVPRYVTMPTSTAIAVGASITMGSILRGARTMRKQYQLRSDLHAQDNIAMIPALPVRMHLPMEILDNEVSFQSEIGEMSLPASLVLQSFVPLEYSQDIGEAFEQREGDVEFEFGTNPANMVIDALERFDPAQQEVFLNRSMPALVQIGEGFSEIPNKSALTKIFVGTLSLQQTLIMQAGLKEGGDIVPPTV